MNASQLTRIPHARVIERNGSWAAASPAVQSLVNVINWATIPDRVEIVPFEHRFVRAKEILGSLDVEFPVPMENPERPGEFAESITMRGPWVDPDRNYRYVIIGIRFVSTSRRDLHFRAQICGQDPSRG